MANCDWDLNYGKVGRLYPDDDRTYFTLVDGKTAMNPVRGYYFIHISHNNYSALIELLYKAADKRCKIGVQTNPKLSNGFGHVRYLVVDF